MIDEDQSEPDEQSSYTVGYGKPPAHSRFKPGRSGNPKGKKKGAKSCKAIVSGVLSEKVPVKTSRGTKKMTKLEALVHTTMNDALKGDPKAADRVMKLARDAGMTDEVADALEAQTMKQLLEEDQAILKRFGRLDEDIEPGKAE